MTSNVQQVAHLQQRMNRLEHEIEKIREHISEKITSKDLFHFQERIEKYISEQKSSGRTVISILDISHNLSIPIEHVDHIMNALKSKGIKEVE